MRKLMLLTLVAVLALSALPALASDTASTAPADVTLEIEPYAAIEIGGLVEGTPTYGAPVTIMVNPVHWAANLDSGIIGGSIMHRSWWNVTCYYHITCALDSGVATGNPDWNLYIPSMGEYNTFYADDPLFLRGIGLGSSIILDLGDAGEGGWDVDADTWNGEKIGTVTMTIYPGISPTGD